MSAHNADDVRVHWCRTCDWAADPECVEELAHDTFEGLVLPLTEAVVLMADIPNLEGGAAARQNLNGGLRRAVRMVLVVLRAAGAVGRNPLCHKAIISSPSNFGSNRT